MGKDIAGLREFALYSYSLNHLKNKDKVLFYYALKGRDGKSGIIKLYDIEQIAKSVLLVSKNKEKDLDAFLMHWKCRFKKKEVYIKK